MSIPRRTAVAPSDLRRSRPAALVPLNRALSRLGVASRADATALIREGRVRVDGRIVRDPATLVRSGLSGIRVDGAPPRRPPFTTLALHKPRGVLTTRRDPEGRPRIYDLLPDNGSRLVPVGRLDMASTGLLLLTNDLALAAWLTDPTNRVPRVYVVTVRGLITERDRARLERGLDVDGERLVTRSTTIRKASHRESHLVVTLTEGKNREIRRLFGALGHEVTRLKRVSVGGLELGPLPPGRWRALSRGELRTAFPDAPLGEHGARPPLAPSRGRPPGP
jgi:23S rRNA pseudouridine2605 synthase